jgi:3-oxoacyl-[acyl-carrier-protein] synthase II
MIDSVNANGHVLGGAMRRVVITGLGAVTPLGNTVKTLWHNLIAGVSGIESITRFDTRDFVVRIAGEVKDFVLDAEVEARNARRMALSVRYALNAVLEAVRAARLDLAAERPERVGVVYASCAGGLDLLFEAHDTLRDRGPRRVSPTLIANMLSDSASGYIAIPS